MTGLLGERERGQAVVVEQWCQIQLRQAWRAWVGFGTSGENRCTTRMSLPRSSLGSMRACAGTNSESALAAISKPDSPALRSVLSAMSAIARMESGVVPCQWSPCAWLNVATISPPPSLTCRSTSSGLAQESADRRRRAMPCRRAACRACACRRGGCCRIRRSPWHRRCSCAVFHVQQ